MRALGTAFGLTVAAMYACTPDVGPGPGDGGGTGGGSNTAAMCAFSGGKTGSVPCAFGSATWVQSTNRTTLQVSSGSGASPAVSAQFVISSTPGTSSYSGGNGDTECTIDVTEGSKHWSASSVMALGACSLTLRSVRVTMDGTSMRTYDLHGGFSASVEPDDGMGGAVTLTSSF
ncbi:MAG: hypothetical protein IPJ65_19240 [Archangiaceae bacterium]|nr:hypothetical protein [Archangiaceae bacterium]